MGRLTGAQQQVHLKLFDRPMLAPAPFSLSKCSFPGTLLLATLVSGILGFTIARLELFGSITSRTKKTASGYGTPEDVEKAIKALREALGTNDESVSTTAGVLHSHGFSPYLIVAGMSSL